jgi:integrase
LPEPRVAHIHGHRLYPLFHMIAVFGLGCGEAAGLRWCDTDLDHGLQSISRQIRQYADESRSANRKARPATGSLVSTA